MIGTMLWYQIHCDLWLDASKKSKVLVMPQRSRLWNLGSVQRFGCVDFGFKLQDLQRSFNLASSALNCKRAAFLWPGPGLPGQQIRRILWMKSKENKSGISKYKSFVLSWAKPVQKERQCEELSFCSDWSSVRIGYTKGVLIATREFRLAIAE